MCRSPVNQLTPSEINTLENKIGDGRIPILQIHTRELPGFTLRLSRGSFIGVVPEMITQKLVTNNCFRQIPALLKELRDLAGLIELDDPANKQSERLAFGLRLPSFRIPYTIEAIERDPRVDQACILCPVPSVFKILNSLKPTPAAM